ncbi:AAA family ATPase [uncultured Lamprocystis sp.]|jgi:general secretion pathway protein A|uniref:ExeA family protein n=1 Tax=uncultured Lamprocystis sp. TaxID=543132 RepID=UPI0025F5E417|nr:AAA family ATPase [uncultured Lamprocystis sp.]
MADTLERQLSANNPPAPPFDNTRDTRYFFPSAGHAEALSRLLFLAEDRNMGMGLLTGEIGSGKTMLRTVLHSRLSPETHVRVSIENSLLDFDDLLLEILSQIQGQRLRAADYPDRYSRLAAFKRLLTEQIAGHGRHLVILLDEAQQLDLQCLDAVKGLTNIASERQNFLTVILIGQPELRERLRQLPQVDQRVSLRFHLAAMTADETREYVRHRLTVAGHQGDFPFDPEALDALFRASRGIPREVNRICKIGLEHILAAGLGRFTGPAVAAVVDDLRRHGGLFDAGVDPP